MNQAELTVHRSLIQWGHSQGLCVHLGQEVEWGGGVSVFTLFPEMFWNANTGVKEERKHQERGRNRK